MNELLLADRELEELLESGERPGIGADGLPVDALLLAQYDWPDDGGP